MNDESHVSGRDAGAVSVPPAPESSARQFDSGPKDL